MDREQTEILFAEAQRLRSTLVEASQKLAGFTRQLRELLDLTEADGDPNEEEENRDER